MLVVTALPLYPSILPIVCTRKKDAAKLLRIRTKADVTMALDSQPCFGSIFEVVVVL